MLAKDNRSAKVTESCARHGGFYLGSIGGPAARLAQDCIRKVDVIEYPELGMEAVLRIEVVDFPRSSWWTTRATTSSPSRPSRVLQVSFRG
jgi:fumarate hydratase class I